MPTPRTELARALRSGDRAAVIWRVARMTKLSPKMRSLLANAAGACLLCEVYEGAPESEVPFDDLYHAREAAFIAVEDEARRVYLKVPTAKKME